MTEYRRIQELKGTLYINIPRRYADEIGLNKGDLLYMETKGKDIQYIKIGETVKTINLNMLFSVQVQNKHSLYVAIPKETAKEIGLHKGDYMHIQQIENGVKIWRTETEE